MSGQEEKEANYEPLLVVKMSQQNQSTSKQNNKSTRQRKLHYQVKVLFKQTVGCDNLYSLLLIFSVIFIFAFTAASASSDQHYQFSGGGANLLEKQQRQHRHHQHQQLRHSESHNHNTRQRNIRTQNNNHKLTCSDKIYRASVRLLKQHLETLSMAASSQTTATSNGGAATRLQQAEVEAAIKHEEEEEKGALKQTLSQEAKSNVSQIFMDNLQIFIEKHCMLNDALYAQDNENDYSRLNQAEDGVDARARMQLEKTLKLALETFNSTFHVDGEIVLAAAKADEPNHHQVQLEGGKQVNKTSSGVGVNSSSPDKTTTAQANNWNAAADDATTRTTSPLIASQQQQQQDNNDIKLIEKTKLSSVHNGGENATSSMRDIRVLAGLRPRALAVRLNKSMKIVYSEYMDNYAKRLLVFENATNVLIMVAASRYHLHGTSIYLFTWLLLVVILMGNCYILVSTRSCRRRRSNVNFFIVHLAIADLLVGIFSMCSDALIRYLRDFSFGYTVCIMYKFLSVIFIFLSTYMLVALGFDRREAVVYPLNFARHRYRGTYLVSGAWLWSAILASPILFLMQVVEVDGIRQCNIVILTRTGWKIYVLYMLTFVIIIPSILLIGFYSQIVSTINKKCRQAASLERDLKREIHEHLATTEQTNNLQQQQSTLNESSNAKKTTSEITIEANNEIDVESSSEDDDDNETDNNASQCTFIKALTCSSCSSSTPQASSSTTPASSKSPVDVRITLVGNSETGSSSTTSGTTASQPGSRRRKNATQSPKQANDCATITTKHHHFNHQPKHSMLGVQLANEMKPSSSLSSCSSSAPQSRSQQQQQQPQTNVKIAPGNLVNRQHGRSVIPKARLKTIQMTIAIVIAFLVCWLPFYVVNIISIFNLVKPNAFLDMLNTYTNIFCFLNSAMNPVLYFWFSHNKPSSSSSSSSAAAKSRSAAASATARERVSNCRPSTLEAHSSSVRSAAGSRQHFEPSQKAFVQSPTTVDEVDNNNNQTDTSTAQAVFSNGQHQANTKQPKPKSQLVMNNFN